MPRRSRPTSHSFAPLEPLADGFRNYVSGRHQFMSPEEALVDRAQLLSAERAGDDGAASAACACSAPMPAAPSTACSPTRPGTLTNDFFVNLLDMGTEWSRRGGEDVYRGPRPQDRSAQVDRHPRRPDLRLALAAARARRGLRQLGFQGEVRQGLRRGLDQGDEPRPLRAETEHRPHRRLKRTRNGAPLPAQAVLRPGAAHRLQIWRQSPHHGWC